MGGARRQSALPTEVLSENAVQLEARKGSLPVVSMGDTAASSALPPQAREHLLIPNSNLDSGRISTIQERKVATR